MLTLFILTILFPILFIICGKIVDIRNEKGLQSKFLIKIGIALIVLEMLSVLALMESIINLIPAV